jgi:hypothetical protein
MDLLTLNFEALKLARDWSTWLVGINIAMLGGLFSLLVAKERVLSKLDMVVEHKTSNKAFDGRYLLLGGVLCLAISVSWACIFLAGLPDAAVQMSSTLQSGGSIYTLTISFPFPGPIAIGIPLWLPMFMQNSTFGLGTLLVVLYLWSLFAHDMRPSHGHS